MCEPPYIEYKTTVTLAVTDMSVGVGSEDGGQKSHNSFTLLYNHGGKFVATRYPL